MFQGIIPSKNGSNDSESGNKKDVVADKLESGQGLERSDADKNNGKNEGKCDNKKDACNKGTSDNDFFNTKKGLVERPTNQFYFVNTKNPFQCVPN